MRADVREQIKNSFYCLELKGSTKREIIEEMVAFLTARGKIEDGSSVLKAVMDREAQMSTGMQDGIALPHGKTNAVKVMLTAFGLKRQGVDFDSADGKPSRIFIMTISPPGNTGPHVRYLSQISRLLTNAALRKQILAAGREEAVIDILAGSGVSSHDACGEDKCERNNN